MKQLRMYLFALILLCASVVGYWAYTRYFKSVDTASLTFVVERGSLDQLVRARGKVVTQKAYDLSFATFGTIKSILVKEGDVVVEHQPLVQLETKELGFERARLASVLSQRQSAYDKLLAGARSEEVAVYVTKVQTADVSFQDAQQSANDTDIKTAADLSALYEQVPDVLSAAFVSADDAIRQQTEALFSNDDTANPKLTFMSSNTGSTSVLETDRVTMGQELKALSIDVASASHASSVVSDGLLKNTDIRLAKMQTFLDRLASVLNSTINLTDTTIATYKTNVNAARTNVNTARTNLTSLQQKIAVQKTANQQLITQAQAAVHSAKNALSLAQNELSLRTAGALSQDLSSAFASISEVRDQIASVDDQISQSTIEAPTSGTITHIAFEKQEVVQAGVPVIHFSSDGQKIESDVNELDIAKIREDGTQRVTVKLDAYPETLLKGHVMSVDALEVVKDGDTYYRANILLDEEGLFVIRSGMSADVTYHVSTREHILTVPVFVVRKKDDQFVVTVLKEGKTKDIQVKTGITDGDRVEIIEGLTEGDVVVTSAS